MRIAIVHDWLDTWRGGENVLAAMIDLYPAADLLALVDFLPERLRGRLHGKRARTSFLQNLPFARSHFRSYLPLMPRAIESLDLRSYDLILSSSHAVAKGVMTSARQLHICYCHTPMRYAWDLREQYLSQRKLDRGLKGLLARHLLDHLRRWDCATAPRVNHFVANSANIRDRIARCYGREATVVYPPVDVEFFAPAATPQAPIDRTYYMAASRWVPYKRMDAIVEAFRALPDRSLVVAGDGPEARRVRAAAGNNVQFVGELPRERLRDLLQGARAFVFAADEDFGILPVEAQACGTPVIAYGHGGALETVTQRGEARTGTFFREQTPAAIAAAIRDFDLPLSTIAPATCARNAERFAAGIFAREMKNFVECAYGNFTTGRR
ncbi:MAG: glycosyltransferase [Betaproteobacteria bacterium]|nr:glycosyltransferase [Betaproteobacteria bacterium]